MRHDAIESGMDVPWWTLTPAEAQQVSAALNREPRVIPELRALIEDYCGRDSCWLEPGHDGECKPGGYVHGIKGAAQVNERTLLVIPTAEGRRTELSSVSDEQYEAVRERLRELCDLCHLLEEENGEEGNIPLHM